jgi:hypothetical protein
VVERKPRREKLSLTSLKADAVTNDVELVETKLLVPSLGSQKSIGTTEVAGSGGSGGEAYCVVPGSAICGVRP